MPGIQESLIDALNNALRVAIASVSGTVSVGNSPNVGQTGGPWAVSGTLFTGGYTAVASGSLTRPSGTVTYTANTAVANATGSATFITLANAARAGGPGTGVILGALMLDQANQTLLGQFELWIYAVAPASPVNDDANWTPTLADLQNLVGVIAFNTSFVGNNSGGAAGNVVFIGSLFPNPMPFKLPSGTSLYAQMVVRNAYVPITREVFTFQLLVEQD